MIPKFNNQIVDLIQCIYVSLLGIYPKHEMQYHYKFQVSVVWNDNSEHVSLVDMWTVWKVSQLAIWLTCH